MLNAEYKFSNLCRCLNKPTKRFIATAHCGSGKEIELQPDEYKCFTPEASVYLIQAKYKDNKTYDSVMWLTNQAAFLLNDFGKTIERLI